jgi:5-methylcytosine-specific restriction endonuclease McrA
MHGYRMRKYRSVDLPVRVKRCAADGCGREPKGKYGAFCAEHNPSLKHCGSCGRQYDSVRYNQKYCESCVSAPYRKECANCGKPFMVKDLRRSFCSASCGIFSPARKNLSATEKAVRREVRAIQWLGMSAKARNKRAAKKHAATQRRIGMIQTRLGCQECGVQFRPPTKSAVYCSQICQRKNGKRRHRVKRRAVERGAYAEVVNPFRVFSRDGWHCASCGTSTPLKARGTTYPNAPELDHIIPISKGGQHTYLNTQCLCRTCNQRKSDKMMGQPTEGAPPPPMPFHKSLRERVGPFLA